ncbi:MAG TPA: hypothetical protein DCS63_00875 [Elusimicrobia bacterium]|nr:hypothetical protein [Elusimicrobiota bacterium]
MKAVVLYSGGKDGHMTLLRALDEGAEIAALLYLDGGRNHPKLFHDSRKAALLKELARKEGYRFLSMKVSGGLKSDAFLERMRDFIKDKAPGAGAVYMGVTDELPEENAMHRSMAGIFRQCGLKCRFPLLNSSFGEVLSEVLEKKIQTLITGVIGTESCGYLGKTVDKRFVRHAVGLLRDSNWFQTLVIGSPAFRYGIRIKKTRRIDTAEEGSYLEILDWEVG